MDVAVEVEDDPIVKEVGVPLLIPILLFYLFSSKLFKFVEVV